MRSWPTTIRRQLENFQWPWLRLVLWKFSNCLKLSHPSPQLPATGSVKRCPLNLFVRLLQQAGLTSALSASSYSERNPHPTFLYSPWSTFIKIHPGFLWIIITRLIMHSHFFLRILYSYFHYAHTGTMVHHTELGYNCVIELFAWKLHCIFFLLQNEKHFLFYPWIPQRPRSIFMAIVHCVLKKEKEKLPNHQVAFADTREFSIATSRVEPPETTTVLVLLISFVNAIAASSQE